MKEYLIGIVLILFILFCYTIVDDTVRVEKRDCDVYHADIDPRVHGPRCRSYEND